MSSLTRPRNIPSLPHNVYSRQVISSQIHVQGASSSPTPSVSDAASRIRCRRPAAASLSRCEAHVSRLCPRSYAPASTKRARAAAATSTGLGRRGLVVFPLERRASRGSFLLRSLLHRRGGGRLCHLALGTRACMDLSVDYLGLIFFIC